ncbi:MAG: HAD family hydrolase, partial [Kiritimatiellia bacterium]
DPEIFHRALRTLNVRAQDAVFVGDNPEADIHAAKAVGLKAVWMEDPYWPAPSDADATISELCALPETIDRINTREVQGDAPDMGLLDSGMAQPERGYLQDDASDKSREDESGRKEVNP